MILESWISAFLAIFAILNPIGLIPLFMEIVEGLDRKDRIRVFNVTVLTGFVTMTTMTFTGKWILANVFRIDIQEFRIAGGLLLTILAVRYIIFPEKEKVENTLEGDPASKALELSVVPMAVPLLVGPGSIVTGILVLDQNSALVTLLALIAGFAVCWGLFQLTPVIGRLMGKIGRLVIGRVLWIFIAAIGVHLLVTGIRAILGG